MKNFKWQSLLAIIASLGIAISCSKSGSGGAPGYPTYDDYETTNGISESSVKYSFFGKTSSASNEVAQRFLDETSAFLYNVIQNTYNNNTNYDCTLFAFSKPSCKSYFYSYLNTPYDRCFQHTSSITSSKYYYPDCGKLVGNMGLWVEILTNGKMRIKIQGQSSAYYSFVSVYNPPRIAEVLIKNIDIQNCTSNDEVQCINGGEGYLIRIPARTIGGNEYASIQVRIDEISPDTGLTTATVSYGRNDTGESPESALKHLMTVTLKAMPLL